MPSAATGGGNITSANSASATSLSATKPTNVSDLDLLWAVFIHRNAAANLTADSGWSWAKTEGGNGTFGFATKPIPSASAETPTSYAFSTDGGSNRCVLGLGRITGANLASPIDAVGTSSVFTGTTSLVLPSLTTTQGGCLLLAVEMNNTSSGTVSTFTLDPAMTGTTQLNVNTGTNTTNFQLGQQQLASAGATGTRTPTMSPAAANSGGFLVAIAPAVRGVPPRLAPVAAVQRAATW